MPAKPNPVVFVHGYSDKGASWAAWREILHRRLDLDDAGMRTCTYVSLNNEVTIEDLAEAFDRALATQGGLATDAPFDAIVHSTGMLVVRSWLSADPLRGKRLKRLIALAPATFGSPLAKKGRSWLGSVFKGNKQFGPDFLDAGDRILDNLEPASAFSWRLAEEDVFTTPPRYDGGSETPYVFVFCGTGTYSGLRKLVDKPGTDGTVRRAGCGLNVRAIELDMTEKGMVARRTATHPAAAEDLRPHRVVADKWLNVSIPVHLVDDPTNPDGLNHASILSNPPEELQELVITALEMTAADRDTGAGYRAWLEKAEAEDRFKKIPEQYQQFIIHAVDERGDPITDYNLQLFRADGVEAQIAQFDAEVDVYSSDPSYRCFHVDVADLVSQQGRPTPGLIVRIIAASGTPYVGYIGHGYEEQIEPGSWDASLHFEGAALDQIAFFRPYATTLIRLYLERQVLPPDRTMPCALLTWDALV
jgi:pimeloyl-ACP methyl ester carboxylesterase